MPYAPLRNWEIVIFALKLEGGAAHRVHTEDITLRCFALAPDAFSWLKHRNHPDKEVVRKDLIRLRNGQYGGVLVSGRAGLTRKEEDGPASTDGWQLTDTGVKWVIENQDRVLSQLGLRHARTNRQDELRPLQRVLQHPLFVRFTENANTFAPTLGEMAEMLRCRVDSDDALWASRFASLRNQAKLAGNASVTEFLDRCEGIRPRLV